MAFKVPSNPSHSTILLYSGHIWSSVSNSGLPRTRETGTHWIEFWQWVTKMMEKTVAPLLWGKAVRAETVQTGKCSEGCCQRGGWKCTKRWEGTQPGQLATADQRDIPYHTASYSAIKAGGKRRKGGDIQSDSQCLSSPLSVMSCAFLKAEMLLLCFCAQLLLH